MTLPIPADLPPPSDPEALIRLYDTGRDGVGAALVGYAESRDGVGLVVWSSDVMQLDRPRPFGVLPAAATLQMAESFAAGWRQGRDAGREEGERYGRAFAVRGHQAGFRILAGLGEHTDPERFSEFVRAMGGEGDR